MNSDFKEPLNVFNANRVRYLVVGGYAVIEYTEPRYTKDLDLWMSADRENAAAVFESLREFGAPLVGISTDDFANEELFYQMGRPPGRVDVLMSIPGVEFEEAWARRVVIHFEGIAVNLISRDDLIAAKVAAGRDDDLRDVKALQKAADITANHDRRARPKRGRDRDIER